ncbi:MAG: 4Fe-4S dicluster domain-containing protein [Gemmataceae bacterium]|nr:4Fe-4S dicluster domain-containing protein [Gemmataceae bacterium]
MTTPLPMAGSYGKDIDYQRFMDCVHCGLCLGSCPTYNETGNENDSPRGRIYLWRAVADGRAQLTPEAKHHLDLCLECKACESACPSGVKYGDIIGSYKRDMAKEGPAFPHLGWLQRWMLFSLTPYASRMAWALWPLRLAQSLGLRWLIDKTAWMLPASLRSMQEMVPPLAPHHGGLPARLPAEGKRRGKVALLVGCAADAFFPQTTLATARVLQKNGIEVRVPRGQGCCGALHAHAGLMGDARRFVAGNVAAFKDLDDVDAVITNAGGCGPVLKEYGHLAPDDPAAERFARKVRDIHEYLDVVGLLPPTHPVRMKAVYHDACGLGHGQKIRSQPRRLLGLVPGLELLPLPDSEACCGAAGSYNITQPKMSARVGDAKAAAILSTGARGVFTGNVGCLLQIAKHLRGMKPAPWVAHPVDVLWASYSGKVPPEAGGTA